MKSPILLFPVLILAICLTQFAADIYAPSLVAIAQDLNVSISAVQWSMSVYLLGVALSQLVYGPLSDGVGRKLPMTIGLIIMTFGSVLCLFANEINLLIIGRFIQGCGAGACASLWRSVFRDSFTGEELAKYSAYLVIFIMFIVPSAPLLGSYLQITWGWFASFVLMAVYSAVALIGIILGFNETNKNYHLSNLAPRIIFKNYWILLKNPVFMGLTCSTFLSYGAFFAWFVIGPVLLIDEIGLSPILFGWLTFLGGGAAYALAGYLNGRLVKRFGMSWMMRFGWSVMIIAGFCMATAYFITGLNVWSIMIPVILFYFGSTFIWPNAFAMAFTPFGHIAGYAGAMYGFMQICGGAAMAGIIPCLANNPLIFSLIMVASSGLAWIIYETFVDRFCRKDINRRVK